MASTHVNHNIYITEVKTGKCLHSLVGHRRTPWCVTFHPTIPGLVASGCLDGEVRIWDLHVSITECCNRQCRQKCQTCYSSKLSNVRICFFSWFFSFLTVN